MQGGPVDELLGVAVERPAFDQLEVDVGRTTAKLIAVGLLESGRPGCGPRT
jgi:hypothetical protein